MLHHSVMAQNPEIVSALMQAGASVNFKDAFSITPLMLAALNNHSKLCHILVQGGASIDATDSLDRTAL